MKLALVQNEDDDAVELATKCGHFSLVTMFLSRSCIRYNLLSLVKLIILFKRPIYLHYRENGVQVRISE